jgi:drug/metabolite transporter (DMT)-like permease
LNSVLFGELAALGTSACWAFSSIFFTIGGRRVGSLIVNRARLVVAVLLVGMAHLLLLGSVLPSGAGPQRWLWFALSGLVGLVLGDTLLFQSYLMVGTRIGMLLMSLNPIFGAIFAWLLLGETMQPAEILAMAVALGGAAWVVSERTGSAGETHRDRRSYAIGAGLALAAGACQALGLIIAKYGLGSSFSPLSALVMRMSVAMTAMWLWAAVAGQARSTICALRSDHVAELAIVGGAFVGPFLGVWLSLIAVQSVKVGIASTLMAMTPILLLPLVHWIYHERISPRAIAGTVVAVSGVAAMFFV